MKRKLKIMLCVFLGLSLFGCNNTNGATQSNKTDNKAEKENIKKATSKKNTSGIEHLKKLKQNMENLKLHFMVQLKQIGIKMVMKMICKIQMKQHILFLLGLELQI